MSTKGDDERDDNAETQQEPPKSINLKVLSPAFDASEGFNVGAVSVDTTIGALKQRISDLVDSHPAPERQRLIYHGHLLHNDADTLIKVFGSAQIRQESDFTIHLVLRPHPNETTSSSSSTPIDSTTPQPRQQSVRHIPTPTTNTTTDQTSPNNPDNAARPLPHLPRQNPGIQRIAGIPGLPGLPPIPGIPGLPGGPLAQMPGMGGFIPPHFPAMQNQPPQFPGTTTTRTVQGPNGTTYTVRVNQSTFAFHPPLQQHHLHHGMPQQPHLHPHQPSQMPSQPHISVAPPSNESSTGQAFVTATDFLEFAELTSNFAQLMQTEQGLSDQARNAAQTLTANTNAFIRRTREDIARHSPQPSQRPAPTQSTSSQSNQAPTQSYDASATTVYLLSSPTGPQALLFAPQGTYTAQPQQSQHTHATGFVPQLNGAVMPFHAPFPMVNGQHFYQYQQHQPQVHSNPTTPGHAVAPAQHNQPNAQLQNEQEIRQPDRQLNAIDAHLNPEVQVQPVDLLAQWQPLLAQFWLMFRVLLFAYFFFPADRGWYRPLAFGAISIAFYLLNGEGAGRRVRDAVRAWWEGVVGIPARQGEQQPAQPGRQGDVQPAVPEPLVAQQNQAQDLSWLRQTFRPLERALALFLASLWPGIGERAGAARREEDERLRRVEQETAVAQEEARRRQAEESASAAAAVSSDGNISTAVPVESEVTATMATGTDLGFGEVVRERKVTSSRSATVEDTDDRDVNSSSSPSS